jgi:putative ABC transport system permease protein
MTAGGGIQWIRSALVVSEVALAVILLVGAGLFTGSFAKLTRIEPGFDYRNLLVLNVYLRVERGQFEEAQKRGNGYIAQVIEATRQVPGVVGAAAANGGVPLTGSWSRNSLSRPGRKNVEGDDTSVDHRSVTPGYLEMLRIPLIRGRYLAPTDTAGSQPVAVINQTAAQKYFPGEDPLGQLVVINDKERTVVGIVGDVRHLGPENPVRQELYVPLDQQPTTGAALVLKTAGDPLAVLPAVKAAIWSVNKEQRLSSDTVTLEAYMDRLLSQRRFNMALLALFGLLGLVIAAVGIYGVMSYVVSQRTNEIGVRMALGATRGRVVAMVLGRAMVLLAAGLAIGAAVAWPLSTLFEVKTFLFQTEPTSAVVYAAAMATLAATGLAASGIPAARAATIDPLVALRQE